jgi:hypothetical protein
LPSSANFDGDYEADSDPAVSDGTVAAEQECPGHGTGLSMPSDLLQDSMAVGLTADRISFKHPPEFKADGYICDPLLKAGFQDPSHFLLPGDQWPKAIELFAVRMSCSSCLESGTLYIHFVSSMHRTLNANIDVVYLLSTKLLKRTDRSLTLFQKMVGVW